MTFHIDLAEGVHWTYAVFDPTGRYLLMSTNTALIVVLDAITGEKLHELTSFQNGSGRNVEASFSPAGEYVLAGSDDGTIHVWETATGEEVTVWSGHQQAVQLVRWNPKAHIVRIFILLRHPRRVLLMFNCSSLILCVCRWPVPAPICICGCLDLPSTDPILPCVQ
jgi:WD40 repeat protein